MQLTRSNYKLYIFKFPNQMFTKMLSLIFQVLTIKFKLEKKTEKKDRVNRHVKSIRRKKARKRESRDRVRVRLSQGEITKLEGRERSRAGRGER